jgi:hypothetical protein
MSNRIGGSIHLSEIKPASPVALLWHPCGTAVAALLDDLEHTVATASTGQCDAIALHMNRVTY